VFHAVVLESGVIAHGSDVGESQPLHTSSLNADSLVRRGILTVPALEFLTICLAARLNLAVSGPPGSGTRELLHGLVPHMAGDGQILTVQNPDEPSLERPGITSLRAQPMPEDGGPGITRRYLLTLVPKMHPIGLVVDQVQGAEAVPLLQLLLASDGILFSMVAESPQEALLGLENLATVHGGGSDPTLARRILSTALQLVVQLGKTEDGGSVVISVTEVAEPEEGGYVLREIFAYSESETVEKGQPGSGYALRPTGLRPVFSRRIQALGVAIPEHIFS
jgi:pilus assembly protein CpaF